MRFFSGCNICSFCSPDSVEEEIQQSQQSQQSQEAQESQEMTVFAGRYKFLRNLQENSTNVEKLFWLVKATNGNYFV